MTGEMSTTGWNTFNSGQNWAFSKQIKNNFVLLFFYFCGKCSTLVGIIRIPATGSQWLSFFLSYLFMCVLFVIRKHFLFNQNHRIVCRVKWWLEYLRSKLWSTLIGSTHLDMENFLQYIFTSAEFKATASSRQHQNNKKWF